MNFKKTLGLVLTAALVSTSLVAVKPVKAATAVNATVVATAPSSKLTGFNYFFAERSLLVAGEQDTYVVDTDYTGKVQYELWVKKVGDSNAKWQVVSADANGKPGYTEAQDGSNSPYSIKLVSNFKFDQGEYVTAVYAKVAGTDGAKTYGHYINASGIDDGTKTGAEQKYDIIKTGRFYATDSSYSTKYNEMLGDFQFSSDSFVAGQKVTFKGFAGQKSGAKYKLVVRKFGDPSGKQIVLNDKIDGKYASTIDWTPDSAGTYQLIAWSAPDVNKGAARDGWRITTVTVKEKPVVQALTYTAGSLKDMNPFFGTDDFSVNDTKLVDKVLVDGKEATFTLPDATTVRITNLTDDPKTITVVAKDGTQVVVKAAAPAQALTYTAGSLKDMNPFFGTDDFSVNDTKLVDKVLVDGKEATFTLPDATTVRITNLSDDPKTITVVGKDGTQVVVKAATPDPTPVVSKLTYTQGSLKEMNPFFGTEDFKVNDTTLVDKVLVNGNEATFSSADATTIRITNLSDDPQTIVIVDKDGNKVTVK